MPFQTSCLLSAIPSLIIIATFAGYQCKDDQNQLQGYIQIMYIMYIQFNSILLFYLVITYNNLIPICNVVQTMDDETNNILSTIKHTGHT